MVSEPEYSDRGKSRVAGFVLACIVLILMGLANLSYQYVERKASGTA